jgi:WD40 repeat protein
MFSLGAANLSAQEAQPSIKKISVASKASMVRLSPDDHTVAVFNNFAIYNEPPSADLVAITLIDLTTGETIGTLSGYADWVTSVAFTADGSKLASLHRNGDLILWDVAAKKLIRTITTPALGGSPIQFLNDDKTVVMRVGEFWLGALDTDSGAITHLYGRHIDTYDDFSENYTQYPKRGDITFSAFGASPDGHWLVASTQNDEVIAWDMQSGELVALRKPSEKFGLFSIRNFIFSPDGNQLTYFDQSDKKMHVWDIAKQTEQGTYEGGSVSFAVAPDGNRLAWADRNTRSIYLVDASGTDAPTKLVELPETQEVVPIVTSLAFTSDGKQLIVGGLFADEGANEIYVFDLAS